jgi:hypothetical protein
LSGWHSGKRDASPPKLISDDICHFAVTGALLHLTAHQPQEFIAGEGRHGARAREKSDPAQSLTAAHPLCLDLLKSFLIWLIL